MVFLSILKRSITLIQNLTILHRFNITSLKQIRKNVLQASFMGWLPLVDIRAAQLDSSKVVRAGGTNRDLA
jgi:hypothetical protein